MKKLYLSIIISITTLFCTAQYKIDSQKLETIRWTPIPTEEAKLTNFKIDLCGLWQFNTSPQNSFWKKKPSKDWKEIRVPGEWVMQGYDVKKEEYAGYYKTFNIPSNWNKHQIKLKCEAVYSECSIYINGQHAGDHLGGFTPFELDITNKLHIGKNSIAIAVRNESLADSLSSGSQYAVHPLGGITRPIYIIAVPKIHLSSYNVNTTFDKNYKNANLNIDLSISNETDRDQLTVLKLELTDLNNNPIPFEGKEKYNIPLLKAKNKKIHTSVKVSNPLKWDPEHPNLYYLYCSIYIDGKKTQKICRRFGFRQIEIRGNRMFVNNHPIKLRGVCRHEVHPRQGRSLTGDIWEKDVTLFKKGNVNYIRTSHYPPNKKLLDACDKLGMFVEVEGPFCWAHNTPLTPKNYFEGIIRPLVEMVEYNKSHPSILHWSVANESTNFNKWFKEAADLIKKIDPSRPRVFSQWGENSDKGYLEIGNTHYPGKESTQKYKNHKRPVVFDEYCHLNAYNRFELITDPGLRDYWGEGFHKMWEDIYNTPAILGGALWAGIDDSFFLPTGETVGYGTWGPIDGWRREKPEFWHMKKTYSPVKIKLLAEDNKNKKISLYIENRYLFSNLNECDIIWKNNGQKGEINVNIDPGESKIITMPIERSEIKKLTIEIFKRSKTPVDYYLFDFSGTKTNFQINNNESFIWKNKGDTLIGESRKATVKISKSKLSIYNSNKQKIITGFPELMIVPLKSDGGGVQMTKKTPDFDIFSPSAGNRKIEEIDINKSKSEINILLSESYDKAIGKIALTITANGEIKAEYKYVITKKINPRQWGLAFNLSKQLQTITWLRKGIWNGYPENHIGREKGTAELFNNNPMSGLAGPASKPSWDWKEDQTQYGTNDFRSTKRNIFSAKLTNNNNGGIKINSGGLQHIRSWYNKNKITLLVADYDNPGAERFFRTHASQWDKPLYNGDYIHGTITLKLINNNETNLE